jgi:hypothetical protein
MLGDLGTILVALVMFGAGIFMLWAGISFAAARFQTNLKRKKSEKTK